MKLVRPIPFREGYGPGYTRARGHRNYDFAWKVKDAQGMYPRPPGYHGGTDMFAEPNEMVLSPLTGRVVRSERGGGVTGQVFGGIVCVESPEGHAVLMRHVNPSVRLGDEVRAGYPIATVTPWTSGWPHAHVEVYRYWPAPYDFYATVDPSTIEWIDAPEAEADPVADFFFEELPHDQGGIGPVIVWHGKGSTVRAMAVNKAKGRIVSSVRDASGVGYVLWWLDGTYKGGLPIFGPWLEQGHRDASASKRTKNTGRQMRRFRGRQRSYYPIPAV